MLNSACRWCIVKKTGIFLTIPTGKSCVLLDSVQAKAAWLLLIFFICLHNQLSSIHSVLRIKNADIRKM